MARKRHTAEEIVAKLRQVDVLMAQGRQVADAVRAIGVTEVTYYRWRNEYGGLKGDQVKRLAEHFDVHPNQITAWQAQLEGGASGVFGSRCAFRGIVSTDFSAS